jgi:hypothetical protein
VGRSNRLVLAIAPVLLIFEGPAGFVGLREPAVLCWLHFLAGFFGLLIAVRPQFLIGRFSEESEAQWDHAYGTTGPRHTGLVWRAYPKLISMVGIVYILRGVLLVIMSASPTTRSLAVWCSVSRSRFLPSSTIGPALQRKASTHSAASGRFSKTREN